MIRNILWSSVYALTQWGVADYITVMAWGVSDAVIAAACDAAHRGARYMHCHEPKIAAVTMLSSMSPEDYVRTKPRCSRDFEQSVCSLQDMVLHNARRSPRAGAQALVVSMPYIKAVRAIAAPTVGITTGIVATKEEKRVGQAYCATVREAVDAGASMLVLGKVLSDLSLIDACAFLHNVRAAVSCKEA